MSQFRCAVVVRDEYGDGPPTVRRINMRAPGWQCGGELPDDPPLIAAEAVLFHAYILAEDLRAALARETAKVEAERERAEAKAEWYRAVLARLTRGGRDDFERARQAEHRLAELSAADANNRRDAAAVGIALPDRTGGAVISP